MSVQKVYRPQFLMEPTEGPGAGGSGGAGVPTGGYVLSPSAFSEPEFLRAGSIRPKEMYPELAAVIGVDSEISEPIAVNKTGLNTRRITFSPDEKIMAIGHSSTMFTMYETETFTPLSQYASGASSEISAFTFSPDGSLFVAGGSNSKFMAYQVTPNELVPVPIDPPASTASRQINFSPDGKWMYALDAFTVPYMQVYSVQNGVFTKQSGIDPFPYVRGGGLSATGHLYVVGSLMGCCSFVISGETFTAVSKDVGNTQNTSLVAISPNGRLIVAAGSNTPSTAYLLDVAADCSLSARQTLIDNVVSATFSPDGAMLALGLKVAPYMIFYNVSPTGTIIPSNMQLPGIPQASMAHAVFSPKGTFFATGESTARPIFVYKNVYDRDAMFRVPSITTDPGINAFIKT